MEGASGPIGGPHHWHLARETRRWLEARRKNANSLATSDGTNERSIDAVYSSKWFVFCFINFLHSSHYFSVYVQLATSGDM